MERPLLSQHYIFWLNRLEFTGKVSINCSNFLFFFLFWFFFLSFLLFYALGVRHNFPVTTLTLFRSHNTSFRGDSVIVNCRHGDTKIRSRLMFYSFVPALFNLLSGCIYFQSIFYVCVYYFLFFVHPSTNLNNFTSSNACDSLPFADLKTIMG